MRTCTSTLLACALAMTACVHRHDARTVREIGNSDNLTYTVQIDATRLVRGSGLGAGRHRIRETLVRGANET